MAYGRKYFFETSSQPYPELGVSSVRTRVSFFWKDFSGTAIEIKASSAAVKVAYADRDDNITKPIRAKILTMSLVALGDIELDEFYAESDRDCYVVWDEWVSGTTYTGPKFTGWLSAFDGKEPYISKPYVFDLKAYCGLASLKDFKFSATGQITFNEAIRLCLINTGLTLNYATGVETRLSGSTGDPLQLYGFHADRLNGLTCYDALTKILGSFVADVEQSNNTWLLRGVVEQAQDTLKLYTYNSAGTLITGNVTTDYSKNVGRIRNNRNIKGAMTRSNPALSYVEISYELGAIRNLLTNGSFTQSTTLSGTIFFDDWNRNDLTNLDVEKMNPGLKLKGRTPLVLLSGKPQDLLNPFKPLYEDTGYFESNPIVVEGAESVKFSGKFTPHELDYAKFELYLYDPDHTEYKLWLAEDGSWKETREIILIDYKAAIVRTYGDIPPAATEYPFEIKSPAIPARRVTTTTGTRPYLNLRYTRAVLRVYRGAYNNQSVQVESPTDPYIKYESLFVSYESKDSTNFKLVYGFKNSKYVRKNTDELTSAFGGYSVQLSEITSRKREAYLNSYASVILRTDGTEVVDEWVKPGISSAIHDFVKLNGISRMRLNASASKIWEGDIIETEINSSSIVVFDGLPGRRFKFTSFDYDVISRTISGTLHELLNADFDFTESLAEESANSSSGSTQSVSVIGSSGTTTTEPTTATDDKITERLKYAYTNEGEVSGAYDVLELKIGSHKDNSDNWDDVENAPVNLPTGGHFLVHIGEDSKTIQYVVDVADAISDACFSTRSASMVVSSGTAEDWNYLAQGETMDFGKIKVASKYDQGRATELEEKVYNTEFIDETASLNRGSKSGVIDFNKIILPGDYDINFSYGSKNAPPTPNNRGRLHVETTGCVVSHEYYPYGTDELIFRDRALDKVWASWFTATAGNVKSGDKVQVPTYYRQGRASGYAYVELYGASYIDSLTTSDVPEGSRMYWTVSRGRAAFSAGTGINITDGVISYTGTTTPIVAGTGITYNSGTGVIATTITQYTDALARAALSAGTGISYNSSTGVISWSGSTTPIAGVAPIAYNGTTGDITWNGTTSNVPEGSRLYYNDTRARAALSAGTGISYNSSTGVISSTISQYSDASARSAISAGTGISYNSTTGVISSTITQYTDALARAAHSAGTGISYNSTTGVISSSITQYTDALARASISAGTGINYNSTTGVLGLATVHAGISGGATTKTVTSVVVDVYGRTTGMVFSDIAFPVTSVNSLTGAVTLTTDNVSEGTTNKYFSTALARAAFSAGTGIAIASGVISSTITQYTDTMARAAISATAPIVYSAGVISWNGTTSDVPEGSRLYYTDARSRAAHSAGTGISYNSTTGVISSSITQYTDALARAAISAGTGISYNSTTGVITSVISQYSDALARAAISAGAGITYNNTTGVVGVAAIHAGLSGGSTTTTPSIIVNTLGQVTSMSYSSIAFPVTSVNSQTGAVVLTTDNVSEGTTNKYFSNTLARGAFSAGTGISIVSGVISYSGSASVGGSGTTNYITKWTSGSGIGNSSITDDGSIVKIGAPSSIGKLAIEGAVWATGDGNAVSYYVAGGGAIRSFGNMYLDSYSGEMTFRTGASFTSTLNLKSTGQVRFNGYTSTSSFAGTRAGLLGFDSTGNVLTVAASDFAAAVHDHDSSYYTKTQSDARYLQSLPSHNHDDRYYTETESDARYTQYGHNHDDRYYTEAESDSRYAAAGHNHHYDYYTKTELNSSGAGGQVHWNNLTGVPGLSYSGHNHDDRYYTETESDGRFTQYGHTHDDRYYTEGEVNSLLSGKSDNGHNHDSRYLQYETDPTEVTGLSASVGSTTLQLYIGKKNGGSVGSGVIDMSNIANHDPYGIADVFFSRDAATVYLNIDLRNGTRITRSFTDYGYPG